MEKVSVEQFRVVIGKEANDRLEEVVKKVMEEGNLVNVTKCDLAEYVFLNLDRLLNDNDIKKIRSLHFDSMKALRQMSRKAKKKELSSETKMLLREYYEKQLKKDTNGILKAV